jgi:hypothetical protein
MFPRDSLPLFLAGPVSIRLLLLLFACPSPFTRTNGHASIHRDSPAHPLNNCSPAVTGFVSVRLLLTTWFLAKLRSLLEKLKSDKRFLQKESIEISVSGKKNVGEESPADVVPPDYSLVH